MFIFNFISNIYSNLYKNLSDYGARVKRRFNCEVYESELVWLICLNKGEGVNEYLHATACNILSIQ